MRDVRLLLYFLSLSRLRPQQIILLDSYRYEVRCLGWLIFLLLLSFSAKSSSVLSKEQKEHNKEWKCVNEVCSKDAQPEKMTWNVNDMTRIRLRSYLASVHAFHFSRLLVEEFANSISIGISYCCGCGGSIKCTVFGLSVSPIKCISWHRYHTLWLLFFCHWRHLIISSSSYIPRTSSN